jgi:hypothetical protein
MCGASFFLDTRHRRLEIAMAPDVGEERISFMWAIQLGLDLAGLELDRDLDLQDLACRTPANQCVQSKISVVSLVIANTDNGLLGIGGGRYGEVAPGSMGVIRVSRLRGIWTIRVLGTLGSARRESPIQIDATFSFREHLARRGRAASGS